MDELSRTQDVLLAIVSEVRTYQPVSWGELLMVLYVCLVVSLKIISFTANKIGDACEKKYGRPLPKIFFDWTFLITIQSLHLNQSALDVVNLSLHYNCQFEEFSIHCITLRLFPYIHVVVDGIVFKGFALPPSKWSMEGVIAALKENRIAMLDSITRRLYKILFQSFKITEKIEKYTKEFFLGLMHFVDIIIGNISCDIKNVDASFCAKRNFTPSDVALLAHIDHIEVTPCSSWRDAILLPMFEMKIRVFNVSITARCILDGKMVAPPMLAPVSINGSITLPKIISQMIRKKALPTKYCRLNLKAPHVIVDLCKVNTAGLMDFSLAIIYYRMWYTGVMAYYEKSLEVATCPEIDPQTAVTNYVALYSNYAQSSGYNLHADASKSIFGVGKEKNTVMILREKCRLYENYMSTEDVIHARVLALGWKEKKELFRDRVKVNWSGDDDDGFFKTMKNLYEQETLAHKEIRNIEVMVTAEQVDFLLSTPRTTVSEYSMDMTNYLDLPQKTPTLTRSRSGSTSSKDRRYVRRADVPPPIMLSVCGVDLVVVDPIIPASFSFDKVRDVAVTVKRIRLSSPLTVVEQAPTCEFSCFDQTLMDYFDVLDDRPEDVKDSSTAELDDTADRFENASSCSDLASLHPMKSDKTIYAGEKIHTRVMNATSTCMGHKDKTQKVNFNPPSSSAPMVSLSIHEDLEYELLTVDAVLSHTIILMGVSNFLGVLEYSLDIVEEASFSLQHWITTVDILLEQNSPPALPTSLLKGKRMKIVAKANELGVGFQEPNLKGEKGRSKLLLYSLDANVYMTSDSLAESLSGGVTRPNLGTYELVEGTLAEDKNPCGVNPYYILLRPATLFSNLLEDYVSSFKYTLHMKYTHPPTIFSEEEINRIHSDRTENVEDIALSDGVFIHKGINDVTESKPSNILFRHVEWKSDPFVVSVSEQEVNIIIHWLEFSIQVGRTGTTELKLGRSRLAKTAKSLNVNASMEEFKHHIQKTFKQHDLGEDDQVDSQFLRSLYLDKDIRAALLEIEKNDHEKDLMFVFSPDLKGYSTLNSILANCNEICEKCSWDTRGNVPMTSRDFIGNQPSAIFSDALHDGSALTLFWNYFEEQTGISRDSGNLSGISSAAVQMMLIRMCGEATLARALWEKVIRRNLKEKNDNLYPWLIDDDREVFRVPTVGEFVRHQMSGTDVSKLCEFAEASKEHTVLKQKVHQSSENHVDIGINMSVSTFDISAGTIQLNYLDTLLGPLLPRFQFSVSDITFHGSISHQGISPELSYSSNYNLVSRLFGGITLSACFFNSAVSSHEPILEPFSVELGAINIPSDNTEFLVHVKDTGKLTVNISAALLETLSSAVFCIIDNKGENIVYKRDQLHMSPIIASDCANFPSFFIINECGVDLTAQTFVTELNSQGSESSDPLTRVSITNEKVTAVSIPWSLMYRTYSDNCFPEVLVSSSTIDGHYFTTGSAVPLHSLSVDTLFLTKSSTKGSKRLKKAHYPKKMKRLTSLGFSPSLPSPSSSSASSAVGATNVFKAGIILEKKNNHDFDCGTVFLARSNVRIRNMTGDKISVKTDKHRDDNKGESTTSSLSLNNFEVKSLPLRLVNEPLLTFSIQHADGSWSRDISLLRLIGSASRRVIIGGLLLYLECIRHFDDEDRVEMHDYFIEVVTGMRFVNALPYRVEVKYVDEKDTTESSRRKSPRASSKKTIRTKIDSGEEFFMPVSLQYLDSAKISFRLDSVDLNESSTDVSGVQGKFSDPIDFADFFEKDTANFTFEDLTVQVPCVYGGAPTFKRQIRVKKIRDSSKESQYSDYSSTPSIVLCCDLWIQNNSGIPLLFRFKDTKGKTLDSHDTECGSNQVNLDDEEGPSRDLGEGPVLGLLDTERIQLRIDTEREVVANEVIFNKCSHLKSQIHLPNSIAVGATKFSSWSRQIAVNSASVISGEIECDGLWLGIAIKSGVGVFDQTNIAVITPRYLIQNNTSLDIDFFPVRLWKRLRKSSTDSESQGSRKLAQQNEKRLPNDDESSTSHNYLRSYSDSYHDEDNDRSINVSGSKIIPSKPLSASAFFTFSTSQRRLSNLLHTEYSALSVRINESRKKHTYPINSMVVNILSASNLSNADLIGSSDPFCEVYWQGELVHTTSVISNNLNPSWDESFHLHLKPDELRMSELRVVVYDHDLHQKEFLGQITLKHKDLVGHPRKVIEKSLMQMPRDKERRTAKTQGKIRLCIGFKRDETFNTWTAPFSIVNPISEAISVSTTDGDRYLLSVVVEERKSFSVITVSEHSAANLPAFMIVNKVQDVCLRFRQKHTHSKAYPRQIVRPMEYLYYAWEDCNLPKIIDLVAVDRHGNESPAESYVLEDVGKKHNPLNVSMLDNRRSRLLAKVAIEGHTRKLIISNDYKEARDSFLSGRKDDSEIQDGYENHFRFVCSLSGLSLSVIDEVPVEMIHLSVDDIEVYSLAKSSKLQLTVKHVQLDNMLCGADYPVVLSPFDSGYNSHLSEDYNYFTKDCIPFLDMTLELDISSLMQDTIIVEYFEFRMQELNVFVDFNFIVRLASCMVTPSLLDAISRIEGVVHNRIELKDMRRHACVSLLQAASLPKAIVSSHQLMMFFKALIIHGVAVRITLAVAVKKDNNLDIDPRRIGSQVEYSTIKNLTDLSRGITNINPHFVFRAISISNGFDTIMGLAWRLGKYYIASAGLQALRLLGSAEILGDPAGGLVSLGSSLRMFAIKTKSEIEGQAPVRAEGLKHLVQGVASISFGTVSKVANSVGEHLASVTGSDFKVEMAAKNPSHVGKGAIQGGFIFYKTMEAGVKNVYKKPMEGYRKRSIKKTAKGVVTGISGLALAPIVGALGATAKLTQGIEATAHVFDEKPIGRLRPARSLFYNPQIRPLVDSVFLLSFSIVVRGADLAFKETSAFPRFNFEELDFEEEEDDEFPSGKNVAKNTDNVSLSSVVSPSEQSDVAPNRFNTSAVKACVLVVHMKYGSNKKMTKEMPLSNRIRLSEKDLISLNFKVKSKQEKFEKRMIRITIGVKHKNLFGLEVTVAKGLLHPLDMITFMTAESPNHNDLSSVNEDLVDEFVWQYKDSEKSRPKKPSRTIVSSSTNTTSLSNAPSQIESHVNNTNGVAIVSRGSGSSKVSKYLQSIIDGQKDSDQLDEKRTGKELNAYVTYPDSSLSSKVRQSFFDADSDMHTSTGDIFSVDCHTKVAARKKNSKELYFLRDFLLSSAPLSSTSSDSASTLTMTTPSKSLPVEDILRPRLSMLPKKGASEDQTELYRVAEALKFKLYLSGSYVSASSVHY